MIPSLRLWRYGAHSYFISELVQPHNGQIEVDPGVIVMGYKGDPKLEQRPEWTKDGSIMVFQKLEQDVPEFEKYVTENGKKLALSEKLTEPEGAALFGARLMGRWKSVRSP